MYTAQPPRERNVAAPKDARRWQALRLDRQGSRVPGQQTRLHGERAAAGQTQPRVSAEGVAEQAARGHDPGAEVGRAQRGAGETVEQRRQEGSDAGG